jgi:hypothetical protein
LRGLTAKDYNLPVAEVSRIFMKFQVVTGTSEERKKAMDKALTELGALRSKLTLGALQKSHLI